MIEVTRPAHASSAVRFSPAQLNERHTDAGLCRSRNLIQCWMPGRWLARRLQLDYAEFKVIPGVYQFFFRPRPRRRTALRAQFLKVP
jgi:hypothetical protein